MDRIIPSIEFVLNLLLRVNIFFEISNASYLGMKLDIFNVESHFATKFEIHFINFFLQNHKYFLKKYL